MKWQKSLIQLAFLSLSLALYQTIFQPMYNSWLENMGRSVGVAEVALGFFITGIVTLLITRIVTRRME